MTLVERYSDVVLMLEMFAISVAIVDVVIDEAFIDDTLMMDADTLDSDANALERLVIVPFRNEALVVKMLLPAITPLLPVRLIVGNVLFFKNTLHCAVSVLTNRFAPMFVAGWVGSTTLLPPGTSDRTLLVS